MLYKVLMSVLLLQNVKLILQQKFRSWRGNFATHNIYIQFNCIYLLGRSNPINLGLTEIGQRHLACGTFGSFTVYMYGTPDILWLTLMCQKGFNLFFGSVSDVSMRTIPASLAPQIHKQLEVLFNEMLDLRLMYRIDTCLDEADLSTLYE